MGMCRCHATSYKIVTSLSLAMNEFTSHFAHLDEEGNYKVSKEVFPFFCCIRIGSHFLRYSLF